MILRASSSIFTRSRTAFLSGSYIHPIVRESSAYIACIALAGSFHSSLPSAKSRDRTCDILVTKQALYPSELFWRMIGGGLATHDDRSSVAIPHFCGSKSKRKDSNLRSPAPKAGGLPLSYALIKHQDQGSNLGQPD